MKRFIKENKIFILSSLILTVIVLLPFFSSGLYRGHDLQFHLSRPDGIVQAIQDRQFPIAIYPYKNFGYGYASPLFYSDLFLIIPACIGHIFNIPLLVTYKIVVFIFVWFTSFTTMYVANYFSKNKTVSILAAFILLFCNYYLTDMYIRCALGEIMGISFIPLLVLYTYKFFYENKNNWLSIAVIFTCLLNSHIITFLFCVVFFGVVLLINIKKVIKNKTMIINIIKATVFACLLCCVFILPMLEARHAQDLVINHMPLNVVKESALGIDGIFNDIALQMNFSSNVEGLDEIDKFKSLGLVIMILPLLFVFKKNDKTNEYKYIRLLLIIGFVGVLLSTKLVPLGNYQIFSFIQYPSRFYVLVSVLFVIVIAYSIKDYKKISLYVVIVIAIISSLQSIYLFKAITNSEEVVIIPNNATAKDLFEDRKYAKVETQYVSTNREEVMNGEYLPYTLKIDYLEKDVDYLDMGTYISYENLQPTWIEYERKGSSFTFETNFEDRQWILLPQSYYKGYKAYEILEDGSKKELEIYNDNNTHRLGIKIDAGTHLVYTKYEGTLIQKASAVVSIISYIGLVVLIIKRRKKSI